MIRRKWAWVLFFTVIFLCAHQIGLTESNATEKENPWKVDFRYAPPWWQTSICLPDDWQKTLVGKDGSLLYDFGGPYHGFKTRMTFGASGGAAWKEQSLKSPRIPIVRTVMESGAVRITEEAFTAPFGIPVGTLVPTNPNRPSLDIVRIHYENQGENPVSVTPEILIQSEFPIRFEEEQQRVFVGASTQLTFSQAVEQASTSSTKALEPGMIPPAPRIKIHSIPTSSTKEFKLQFEPLPLEKNRFGTVGCVIIRGKDNSGISFPASFLDTVMNMAVLHWEQIPLPYDRIRVPDSGMQALLDSSIRNIYQAREIKDGLPAFQVGPTVYRGLWVVDGSFIMEAMAFLGRVEEARAGIRYLLNFQRNDGAFMLIDGHWKETGIVLWAVARHARLTNDKAWLRSVWPRLEKGMDFIRSMRRTASEDKNALNAGLIPNGFSDGGLGGKYPEYTNVYWTLAGMRAAVAAAQWLGNKSQAEDWQKEYDDFYATFRRAAERDMKTDGHGNRYAPIRMRDDQNVAPQKAQWAFLHAVFPGKVFAPDDPLVQGNMAMLQAAEREGLVYGTGWLSDGIWNYFGSFYAHAWLWLGRGQKAAQIAYDYANHASPLFVWREEQMPVGQGEKITGDMPHNWASAEFIRLVRHLLVLERGDELHLFEGLPKSWMRPGAVVRLQEVLTEYGPISLELKVSADGASARLHLEPPRRNPPAKIVLHLEGWSGRAGTMELPVQEVTDRDISITK